MKQNLHTHTPYCDGLNTVSEMIKSALHKDFDVLGFSGHSFTPFDKSYCMTEEGTLEYIDDVLAAKKFFKRDPELACKFYAGDMDYRKPLKIYLGIEQDLYSYDPALRRAHGLFNPGTPGGVYDYIIGSTHAFRLTWAELDERRRSTKALWDPWINGVEFSDDGAYIYVDYGTEPFSWAAENIYHGDYMAIAEDYFRDEGGIVAGTDCDIVGHFDLLLKFNEKEKFFDEESPRYKAARDKALERIFADFKAKEREPIFEINTGAMAKGYRSIPYPSPETLALIREMGGQIVINSDCHKAEMLDFGFEEAEKAARKAGFSKIYCIDKDNKAELMDL